MTKSLEKLLALDSLAEAIHEIGYKAKIDDDGPLKTISSAVGGYQVIVMPFSDAIKLRAVFEYFEGFTLDVINKFNVDNRLCKMFKLGSDASDMRLVVDFDNLVSDSDFEGQLKMMFFSFEITMAAFDRLLRQILEVPHD